MDDSLFIDFKRNSAYWKRQRWRTLGWDRM